LALVAAGLFSGVALFQIALALGAPLGAAAWGGAETVLSPERRVSSGVAALILILSALIVCGRAGMMKRTRGWMRLFRVGVWVIAVQMALNTLANLASSSPWERYMMSVLTLTLCALCVRVAKSPVAEPATQSPT
jgi:NADH:ubiquinone oxidoreductase subunit K